MELYVARPEEGPSRGGIVVVQEAFGITRHIASIGDADQGIPTAQVEALRVATATAPVPTEVHRYPGAAHGFNCDDRPSAYHEAAAADAWARTLAWFADHVAAA